jgi:glutathione S-transferase
VKSEKIAMIQVWGRGNSGNVIKVLWCLRELGLPFNHEEVGGKFGKNKEAWFLALNPNGLVPVIRDVDEFVVWESNAIVRYLAAKYGAGVLWPLEVRARSDADRWMDWLALVQPHMTTLNVGLVRTPPEKRDNRIIEQARETALAIWHVLDQHLKAREFVAGAHLTMGDIAIGNLAYRWFSFPIERPRMPGLEAWYQRLASRPAFQLEVMKGLA